MSEHAVAETKTGQLGTTIVCTCAEEFTHRRAEGAEHLWEYHAGLENARLALRGGRG